MSIAEPTMKARVMSVGMATIEKQRSSTVRLIGSTALHDSLNLSISLVLFCISINYIMRTARFAKKMSRYC